MRAFLLPLAFFCFGQGATAQPPPAPPSAAQPQPAYANPATLAQARRIADAAASNRDSH